MRNLTNQDVSEISGGEAWIAGTKEKPALIVTNQSVASWGGIEFHSDYVTVGGHTITNSNALFSLDGRMVFVAPYYDMSTKRIGSIYTTNC